MEKIKRLLPEVLVVALFAVIAFVYFMPADLDGRILYRHDSQAGRGLGHEATEYYQRTGDRKSTRQNTLDKQCLQRNANIPDSTFL